ncbi:hypothetical protein C2G38_711888 [Gigaspora rosea]|uniref:Uncharacterized protein n=1 Tax=Gigaspora rosea TaxID=44941 RepID=A0A397U349_9GLOM|nr:hypothetical protein C2G38_711888 [Gigaspora rosea]
MSFLKENDVRNDNDFIVSVKEFKFEDHYIEEPLISLKANKNVQDLPTKIFEVVPLIINNIDINIRNDQLVPEETGVKAPLEMLNEWEGIDESTFDIEEIPDNDCVEFEIPIDSFWSSREALQLGVYIYFLPMYFTHSHKMCMMTKVYLASHCLINGRACNDTYKIRSFEDRS